MNTIDTGANGMNPEAVTNDLTQLSSREQLSALMDGALPADETRFLLRRLQHDAPLAGCWERWRLTGEVMRGLAPAQRLPADFATRVGAALRGEAPPVAVAVQARTPGWLRWGGGAGMLAASLAVVALMARPPAIEPPAAAAATQVASLPAESTEIPRAPAPGPASGATLPQEDGGAAQALAAVSVAVAAGARPVRERDRVRTATAAPMQATASPAGHAEAGAIAASNGVPDAAAMIPQPDIVTRPWPRSVLPQYASGALAVGFGAHVQGASAYNPFHAQVGLGNLAQASAADGDTESARETPAADTDSPRDAQAKP